MSAVLFGQSGSGFQAHDASRNEDHSSDRSSNAAARPGVNGSGVPGYRARTIVDKLDDWVSVKDYGVKGDGVTDDTAALQRCLDDHHGRTIWFPDGVYLIGPIRFGSNEIRTTGNNPAPLGMIGQSNQGTILRARRGMTGTLLQAWSMAATTFENFTLDGQGQNVKLADWDWKAEVGPSTLNIIRNVRAISTSAEVAVSLNNLNDTTFDRLNVFTGGDGKRVSIQARQSGGMLKFSDCQGTGGYWDLCAQNIILDHCLDEGIQISSGAENLVTIIGGQGYGSSYKKRALWSDNYAINAGLRGLVIIGRYMPLLPSVTAVLDLSIYTGLVELKNCEFDTHGVNLLAPTCTSSYGGSVRVLVQGGACVSGNGRAAVLFNDTHNANGSVISLAHGVTDNATGKLIDKHWAGDLSGITIRGNDAGAHRVTIQGTWRRSMDDMVTFAMRLQWNGLSRTGQPMIIDGMPFAGEAGFLHAITRGYGTVDFAEAEFNMMGGRIHGFRRSDGHAIPVPATGDITIAGTYSVQA